VTSATDAVVRNDTANAVVGHGALLRADATSGAETSGEVRTEFGRAAMDRGLADRFADMAIGSSSPACSRTM
jgi:hypothetical protein